MSFQLRSVTMANDPEPESGASPAAASPDQPDQAPSTAEQDTDFEVTLGTRRDAASEAGSEEEEEGTGSDEGFITGGRRGAQGTCLA